MTCETMLTDSGFFEIICWTQWCRPSRLMSWKPHLPNFPIGPLLNNCQIITSSYNTEKVKSWKWDSGMRGNICDLIIISLWQCNQCLSHAICLFSFELSQTLTSLPLTLTSLESSSRSTRFQKKTLLLWFCLLLLKFDLKSFGEEKGDKKCKNTLWSLWCIPIYVFAFTVLSPADWTTDWLSVGRL